MEKIQSKLSGKNFICAKCNRLVGLIVADSYLVVGNARFYDNCRFSCRCGKSYTFIPESFRGEREKLDVETQQYLNKLGTAGKYINISRPRKVKK